MAALAGCSNPGNAGFEASCPAWSEGRSHSRFEESFHDRTPAVRRDTLGAGLLRDEGRPLDGVLLQFAARNTSLAAIDLEDGRLTARFLRQDDGAPLLAYDPTLGPRNANAGRDTWTFAEDLAGLELRVDLSEPGRAPGTPSAVVVEWHFARDLDGNATTASTARVGYTAAYLYRAC